MATFEFAEGETLTVSSKDFWSRFEDKLKEILLIPAPQLNDDHSEMGKKYYVMGESVENASAIPNAMPNVQLAGFRKFDKLESEMAAKEKVAEEGQDDFTEMTGDAKIDIPRNVPPQVPYVNVSPLGKLRSFFRDPSGKEENYTEMAGDEDKMKIGWKEASCGLIMGANYTALASFEKRDGALGEAAWMAATLAFLITLFGVVAPLKMPRFMFGLAVILTGLSYMAFVAMKFAYK